MFIQSHHPFPSRDTICTISPARIDNSLGCALEKSYSALATGFFGAGALTGGGGGGAFTDPEELARLCAVAAADMADIG